MKPRLGTTLWIVILTLLTACSGNTISPPPTAFQRQQKEMKQTKQKLTLANACLQRKGVRIETLGDQSTLIIPTSSLFYKKSAQLVSTTYGAAPCIQEWVRRQKSITSVNITAYANDFASAETNQHLSQLQATVLKNYLWKQAKKMPAVVYAIGKGSITAGDYQFEHRFLRITVRETRG